MSNYSAIYWITRLDKICVLSVILLTIALIVIVVYHMGLYLECYYEEDKEEYHKSYAKYRNMAFCTAIISGLLLVFVPTKKDIIIIYAGGKTMDFVQSDSSCAKIPHQTTLIISEYLDKSIKELNK